MKFELPEKGDVKTTDKTEALGGGLSGSSLSEMRSADHKSDTSKDFLPSVKFTGVDTDPIKKDPIDLDLDPADFLKDLYNHWLTNSDDEYDDPIKTDRKADGRSADKLASKGEKNTDGYTDTPNYKDRNDDDKSCADRPGNRDGDGPQEQSLDSSNEAERIDRIEDDCELEEDSDGKLKKVTYIDKNGKRHVLKEDQWKNINGKKELPGGWEVEMDQNGNGHIKLPNGRYLLVMDGRVAIVFDLFDEKGAS